MSKKLTRSYDDRWLAGVLSGFAKYFNTKPLYLRITYILFTVDSSGLISIGDRH